MSGTWPGGVRCVATLAGAAFLAGAAAHGGFGRSAIRTGRAVVRPSAPQAAPIASDSVASGGDGRYRTSWFGNSFSGTGAVMQRSIYGFYVSPDGTCYTDSLWDESGEDAGIYRDGRIAGKLPGLHGRDRILGGRAVTGNAQYIYYAAQHAQGGQITWYVGRAKPDDTPAPWPGGSSEFLPIETVQSRPEIEGAAGEIWGMALSRGDLFVACADPGRVLVYDAVTGGLKREFPVRNPGAMTADRQGDLWIVRRPDKLGATVDTCDSGLGFSVLQYTPEGVATGRSLPYVARPLGLAMDDKGRLMVADDGPAQQILIYSPAPDPKLVATFGDKEGLESGIPGAEANLKLPYPAGVGMDAHGDIFVASRYPVTGCEIRAFAPGGRMLWRLFCDQFMNTSGADPASDGTMVYSPRECFRMDFKKPPGEQATLVGHTVDKFAYPDDPRLHGEGAKGYAPLMRRIDGRLFMYLVGERGRVSVFRHVRPGFVFAPCDIFSCLPKPGGWPLGEPESGRWLWVDRNGDGAIQPSEITSDGVQVASSWNQWVDGRGNIWYVDHTRVLELPLLGLDSHGVPQYSLSAIEDEGVPDAFAVGDGRRDIHEIERIQYDARSDTLYAAGYASSPVAVPNVRGRLFPHVLGPNLFCYDHWSTPDRRLRWEIALPWDPADETACCSAFSVAGGYVFVAALGGGGNQDKIWVYSADTGARVLTIVPGANVGETGWIDTAYGIRAFKRRGGEILLFVEDVWKEKQLMYEVRLPDVGRRDPTP